MNTITYNVKLNCQLEIQIKLKEILSEQKDIVNDILNIIQQNQIENLNIKIVHDLCYQKIKSKYPNAFSQIIIKAEQEVLQMMKTIKTNHHKPKLIEKKNLSLRLDKRIYSNFTQQEINISVIKGKKSTFTFKLYKKVKELFEKYQTYDPLIFIRHNQIYLSVPFAIPEINLKNQSTLGVDLGMRRLFVDSDGRCLKSKEYLKHKRRLRYQKRMLNSKNTKSSKRKLKKVKKHEFNYSNNYQQLVANKILETDKSVIVMEDLSKIKMKKNKYQNLNAKSQIPFYGLKEKLIYKATLLGKEVVTVNPSYTSKHDCRGLEDGIRKGCRYYGIDGAILDADMNAACNIAKRHNSEHPISFTSILDGRLNLIGRLKSEATASRVNQPIVSFNEIQAPRSLD